MICASSAPTRSYPHWTVHGLNEESGISRSCDTICFVSPGDKAEQGHPEGNSAGLIRNRMAICFRPRELRKGNLQSHRLNCLASGVRFHIQAAAADASHSKTNTSTPPI